MTPERWQQITDTFHAALAQPAGQRAQFLSDACPGDEALRVEVEAMLGARFFDVNRDVYRSACPTGTAERFK